MAANDQSKVMHHLRRVALQKDGAGLTDAQLLDEYLNRREEAALAALVRRHGPMILGEPVVLAYHAQHDHGVGMAATNVLGLAQHIRGLGECPDLQHACLAGNESEVATQEQRPAGFGVTARSVGDDEIGLLAEGWQAVEYFIRVGKPHGLYVGGCFLEPFGRRLLGIAVCKRDAVPLFVQPGCQVYGEGRFADAALGICDHDNHGSDVTTLAGILASIMCSQPVRKHVSNPAGKQTVMPAVQQASRQA